MTVTPDNIAVRLGRAAPDTPQFEQWEMWIADALMLIDARLGDVTLLDQAKLDYVVREAVARQVLRPDDSTQVTVSVNDASTSRTYRSGTGRVAILEEEWRLLDPTAGSPGKAFEVDTMPADAGVGVLGVDYWWVTPTDIEVL